MKGTAVSSSSDTAPASVTRRPGLIRVAALIALCLLLLALAWARRNANELQLVYETGNILSTHEGSGLSLTEFGKILGHLELASIAVLIAICLRVAPRARSIATASGIIAFLVIYIDSATRYATRLGARLYFIVCDDALISMRYARNFAEGRGLVYNVGEPVDGYTNPLWTMIMVIPHALGLHEGVTTVPVAALGAILLLLTGFLCTSRLLEAAEVPPSLQIVTALVLVFDPSLFEYSLQGLETPLVAMSAALVMAGGVLRRERWVQVGIVLVTLTRADGALVGGLLLAWLALEDRSSSNDRLAVLARRHWKRAALLVAVAVALIAWRTAIYGHPAPNTAYLKVYPLAYRLRTGVVSYGVRGIVMYGLPVLFVLWAGRLDERSKRARRMLVPVLGLWLYAIYVGGDAFSYMRFFSPMTPLLWTAVSLSATSVWAHRTEQVGGIVVVVIALVAPVASERGVLGSAWDRASWIRESVSAAKTVARNVPPDVSTATFYAGLPYYAPTHRFVDMLGKVDSHIAHLTAVHGALPGHNKFDFAYVYDEVRPAVTFTALSCDEVDKTQTLASETAAEIVRTTPRHVYQAPFQQMLNPTFRELYFPQRVILRAGDNAAGHPLGCWFIRRDAPVPRVWELVSQ